MAGQREASFARCPGHPRFALCVWPRRGYPPCAAHDGGGCGADRASRHSRIQLSNSHCSSDMRHHPCCCGAGAPSSLAFPPPCERACGTPGARCTLGPDAECGLPQVRVHQDFRRRRASAQRSACGVFSTCLHFASANDPITELKSQGDGKGASST